MPHSAPPPPASLLQSHHSQAHPPSARPSRALDAPIHRRYEPYWDHFYDGASPMSPTPFAQYAAQFWFPQPTNILELGCGNGRDASWFASRGHAVVGVDLSESAIGACCRQQSGATFQQGDFSKLDLDQKFSVIYSRFTLHSIDAPTESRTLEMVRKHLAPGGRFVVEARTIYDELCGRGTRVSDREWIYENHYRRFLDPVDLLSSAREFGFAPEFILMNRGLALWKDQDPVVIRLSLAIA